jgi:hypothetical protein
MQVHVFAGRGWQGFTPDPRGSNLPGDMGPWQKIKTITMNRGETPRIAVNLNTALSAIGKQGYYVQPLETAGT